MMCLITAQRTDLLTIYAVFNLTEYKWHEMPFSLGFGCHCVSHFNEQHSHANTVCLEWIQMPLT